MERQRALPMDFWTGFVKGMTPAMFSCGRIAISLQGKVEVEYKAKDSVVQTSAEVSVVDRLCQDVLMLQAHSLAPQLDVYSEELADCPPEICLLFEGNAGSRYTLVLDPLDGTKAYLAGSDDFCHMAGVLDNKTHRMVCSMILVPKKGELIAAVRGGGNQRYWIYWYSAGGLRGNCFHGKRVAAPHSIVNSKRMTRRDYEELGKEKFMIEERWSMSSAGILRLITLNVGATVMRDFHGHDSAMASLIIEAAGGMALGVDGKPVRYTKDMPRMPLVVMSADRRFARKVWQAVH